MIHSISEVTKNTNFGSWFKSWWRSEEQAAGTSGREAPTAAAAPPPGSVQANDMDGRLAEVAPYLQVPAPSLFWRGPLWCGWSERHKCTNWTKARVVPFGCWTAAGDCRSLQRAASENTTWLRKTSYQCMGAEN